MPQLQNAPSVPPAPPAARAGRAIPPRTSPRLPTGPRRKTCAPKNPIPPQPAAPLPATEYVRVDRVARRLDISKKRIYEMVAEGKLQAIRLGPRQMRILKYSLESYLHKLHETGAQELENKFVF